MVLPSFVRFPVWNQARVLSNKKMHRSCPRNICLEHMIRALTPLYTSHSYSCTKCISEIRFCPHWPMRKSTVMNWFSWRLYLATNPRHRSSNSFSCTKSSNKAWNFFLKVQFFEYTAPNISFALLSTCHLHQRCRVRGISDDIAFRMAWHWSEKFIKKCNDYKTVKAKQETLL